jgi:hypothetical protein
VTNSMTKIEHRLNSSKGRTGQTGREVQKCKQRDNEMTDEFRSTTRKAGGEAERGRTDSDGLDAPRCRMQDAWNG